MSFDLYIIHRFAAAFSEASASLQDSARCLRRPKFMLLTVASPPKKDYELRLSVMDTDFARVKGWMERENSMLDGLYLQFEPAMLESDGVARTQELLRRFPTLGCWGYAGDPDDLETATKLMATGFTYINTDLPTSFANDTGVTIEA